MKSLPKSRRFLVLIVQLFERNANSPKLEIQFEFRIVRWDHFLFSNPMLMLSWFQATSRFWNKKRPNQTVIIIICVDSIDCLFQNTRSCIQSFIRFVSLILSNWRVSSVFWKISLHSDAVYLLVSFWMALANVPLYQCACYCCYRCSYIQREDRREKKTLSTHAASIEAIRSQICCHFLRQGYSSHSISFSFDQWTVWNTSSYRFQFSIALKIGYMCLWPVWNVLSFNRTNALVKIAILCILFSFVLNRITHSQKQTKICDILFRSSSRVCICVICWHNTRVTSSHRLS